jgi:peptidoglycan hydrolase-like protein with peptidoglycan-binding domain
VIFDFGFYPWWPYGYPYDYYAYDYYPYSYSYDPGYYDSGGDQGEEYYDQNGYESSDQSTDSIVATAQERLAREGYYRGEIDGILGHETRRAVMRYQSDHGLRVTGRLNMDTLRALGLPRVASN